MNILQKLSICLILALTVVSCKESSVATSETKHNNVSATEEIPPLVEASGILFSSVAGSLLTNDYTATVRFIPFDYNGSNEFKIENAMLFDNCACGKTIYLLRASKDNPQTYNIPVKYNIETKTETPTIYSGGYLVCTPVCAVTEDKLLIVHEEAKGRKAVIWNTSTGICTTIADDIKSDCLPVTNTAKTRIAYLPNDNSGQIISVNMDGSSRMSIGSGFQPTGDKFGNLCWLPGRTEAAGIKNGEIVSVNFATGIETIITNTGYYKHSPVFSPDGTMLAYEEVINNQEVMMLSNSDGRNKRHISSFDSYYVSGSRTVWSPDSKVFICSFYRDAENTKSDLMRADPSAVSMYQFYADVINYMFF